MKNLQKMPGKLSLAIAIVAATTFISACGSSSTPRPTNQGLSNGSSSQQIADLNRRIQELTSELEAARTEAAAAKNLAVNAQATADAAQIMAASTDDRIEAMFNKSVFK